MIERFKRWRFLPVAPSLVMTLRRDRLSEDANAVDSKTVVLAVLACALGVTAAGIAQLLTHLIGFVTNLFFFQRFSTAFIDPYNPQNWGLWVMLVPVVGGVIVGLMARFGSRAIRGHGIPEAMENILMNESRIPLRVTFLKPLSAAIAIGTGGPFGAEGPIIATGAAAGSVLGQWLKLTSRQRKILLAAGAAAGMTATFGSPVSAVLLAVELLLFEFHPNSLIPVAIASATAESVRAYVVGTAPIFAMTPITELSQSILVFSLLVGVVMGVASVFVTKVVYAIEDGFEKLPVHWMWWPALGGVVVGVVGYFYPATLGVGYGNIDAILHGAMLPQALLIFCVMKFISWSIALGSGTSGGTLAPLFTFGGGMGSLMGYLALQMDPNLGFGVGMAGLVGMAAIFAGASRALLASVVFAFEVTQQPLGLMPLLAGCSVSYLISGILMKTSIMTEKIERRGVHVPFAFHADPLSHSLIKDYATKEVCSLSQGMAVSSVFSQILNQTSPYVYSVYPLTDENGHYAGVVTREDLIRKAAGSQGLVGEFRRSDAVTVRPDQTLHAAQVLMVRHDLEALPVVGKDGKSLVGMISHTDLARAATRQS
jgi:H+/Cl- antiporter ClcA